LFAAVVPNDTTPGEAWAGYRKTVAEVEELTGYTFFDKVPESIIGDLKSEPDEVSIPSPGRIQHDD